MKIERAPQSIVMGKNGCIDVICPQCNTRSVNEFGQSANKMKCKYCGNLWRVDDKGSPAAIPGK